MMFTDRRFCISIASNMPFNRSPDRSVTTELTDLSCPLRRVCKMSMQKPKRIVNRKVDRERHSNGNRHTNVCVDDRCLHCGTFLQQTKVKMKTIAYGIEYLAYLIRAVQQVVPHHFSERTETNEWRTAGGWSTESDKLHACSP